MSPHSHMYTRFREEWARRGGGGGGRAYMFVSLSGLPTATTLLSTGTPTSTEPTVLPTNGTIFLGASVGGLSVKVV